MPTPSATPTRKSRPAKPARWDLYRHAVQHPQAEVAFLLAAHAHQKPAEAPPATRLKEDFCGSAAVATAFVALDDNHRAIGVDHAKAAIAHARRRAARLLGPAAEDLALVQADVLEIASPKVDIVAALNFSAFIHHEREALLAYFRHARRSLRPGGILALDAYGGPGALRLQQQTRQVAPDPLELEFEGLALEPYAYHWEQRAVDAATGRVDNRIHFTLADGTEWRDAFRYDWRLWTLPELREAMLEAGFASASVWCDRYDPQAGRSDGAYRPLPKLPMREDFVAYVVGRR